MTYQFVQPLALCNLIENPSFEYDTDGWSDLAGGTLTDAQPPSDSVGQVYGQKVGSVAITATGDGCYYQDITLTSGDIYYVRMSVGSYVPDHVLKLSVIRTDISEEVKSESLAVTTLSDRGGRFQEIGFAFTAPADTGYRVQIEITAGTISAPFRYFLIDGAMLAQVDALTDTPTYVDGDQEGCVWNGQEHASISRTLLGAPLSRVAGKLVPLIDDSRMYSVDGNNVGMAPIEWKTAPRSAPQHGADLVNFRIPSRPFSLEGFVVGDTLPDMRRKRNRIIAALSPDRLPYVDSKPSPVRLRYVGRNKTLEIACNLQGGLDYILDNVQPFAERLVLKFKAEDDPLWREIGDRTIELDMDTGSPSHQIEGLHARLDGLWDNLTDPTLAGNAEVRDVKWGPDGKIYFGGDFTDVDGIADTAYLARYDPITETFEAVESTTALNGPVNALLFGPDHKLYIGGEFTNAGLEYLVYVLDSNFGGAGTFTALTAGTLDGQVNALAFDESNGNILAAGAFTTDGTTTFNRILAFDGISYSQLGTGLDDAVNAIAYVRDGRDTVLAGGDFANAGGSSAPYLAAYQDGSWIPVGSSGPNAAIYALRAYRDGAVVAGSFTTMDGESSSYIFYLSAITSDYTGWCNLGDGASGAIYALAVHDGEVYADLRTGTETGEDAAKRLAKWNGTAWVYLDTSTVNADVDNVFGIDLNSKGEIVYATDTSGSVNRNEDTTISLQRGAARTYPKVRIYRHAGTRFHLGMISNEYTGERAYFDIDVLDRETVIVDCETLEVISSLGRPLGVQPGSVPVSLLQGDNMFTMYCPNNATSGTTFSAIWRPGYWSVDAAEDDE